MILSMRGDLLLLLNWLDAQEVLSFISWYLYPHGLIFLGGWERGDCNTWLIWSHITILQSPLSHDIYLRESKACCAVANKNQEAIPSNPGDRKAYSHFVLMFLFRCSWPGGICKVKGLTGKQSEAEMLLVQHAALFTSPCCLTLKPLLVIGGQQSPMAPIGFKRH